MFKELSQIAGLMKQLPKIKEEMENLQQRLAKISAEGDAGGGMVKATVNGKMEVLSCALSDEALKGNDKEMLEDLIAAALNDANRRAEATSQERMGALTAGLPLPPGMKLPF